MSPVKSEISEFFSPGGQLSSAFESYEDRSQQVEMAEAVAAAIGDDKHLIVEAGTGVGKSLAYLLPAFRQALAERLPVVVSTYTINLQEQLLDKDIPLLAQALGKDIRAAVAKGRSNYLCLRRLSALRKVQPGLFEKEFASKQLARIREWSFDTHDGSLSDLQFSPGAQLWEQINSSRFACAGKACAFAEKCFFRRARARVRRAQIVVSNHYLYFSDLSTPDSAQRILPPHTRAIFDEAHTMEHVASECLGITVSRRELLHIIERLAGKGKRPGLLHRLGAKFISSATGLRRTATRFFDAVEDWARENLSKNMRIYQPVPVDSGVAGELRRLSAALIHPDPEIRDEDLRIELAGYAEQLGDYAKGIEIITRMGLESYVYWVKKGEADLALRCAPVRVSGILPQVLFRNLRTCVLTGATLAVGRRDPFGFLRERLGCENFRELQLGSPFDYAKQATIHVKKDLPHPESEEYVPAIVQAMKHYLEKSGGRALVLFTNYEHLQEAASRLTPFLEELGARVLVHGGGLSRRRLLKEFREETNSVLFGTSSFWQGIDVPGESLSNVVITRLPFDVPTVPLHQARCEDLETRNQDPFTGYSLPQAVIRLKQGVGRLIRSKTDSGMIVILDSRIVTKGYGKTFLESLPPCKILANE